MVGSATAGACPSRKAHQRPQRACAQRCDTLSQFRATCAGDGCCGCCGARTHSNRSASGYDCRKAALCLLRRERTQQAERLCMSHATPARAASRSQILPVPLPQVRLELLRLCLKALLGAYVGTGRLCSAGRRRQDTPAQSCTPWGCYVETEGACGVGKHFLVSGHAQQAP